MNVRTLIVGTLAIVSGLSAMILVQALNKGGKAPVVEKVQVVFATADVKPGEVIQEGMIEIRDIPKSDVPEDAILKGVDAIERAAMTQIDRGDMLRQKKLADKGAGRGMTVTIPKDMRAFTITTPTFSSSLAGFILPKNHVDVLLTINVQGNNENETGGAITTTLLQNVEVAAVHTAINTPTASKFTPEEARSVTLFVTPSDAALLDLGQNKGTLHLTLRNSRDTNIVPPKPISLADLNIPALKKAIPPPAPVVVEKPPVVEPPPVFDLPEPEPIEVKLTVRTLRGTSAGQDTLTMLQKPRPLKRAVPTPPAPSGATASNAPSINSSSVAGAFSPSAVQEKLNSLPKPGANMPNADAYIPGRPGFKSPATNGSGFADVAGGIGSSN
jgi:pilus assembly protein CpaB